jgi:hypothetical protein
MSVYPFGFLRRAVNILRGETYEGEGAREDLRDEIGRSMTNVDVVKLPSVPSLSFVFPPDALESRS